MPRSPEDAGKPEDSADGRTMLRQWLQQRIDRGEIVDLVPPVVGPSSKRPTGAKAGSVKPAKSAQEVGAGPKTTAGKKSVPAAATRQASAESLFETSSGVQADPDDSMQRIAEEVNACTRCRLHETRDKSVPGVGPDDANLVFIGEGPGADEDRKGEPFVGRAGQLLTKIIAAVELSRDEVFITNIVKCRPPNNRDPRPDEIEACEPYLKRQLRVLDPKVICTLGRHAAMTLLQTKESMAKLRTGERSYEGVRLFPTYHPAALLRNPQWKRPVWEDIQNVRQAYDEPRKKT